LRLDPRRWSAEALAGPQERSPPRVLQPLSRREVEMSGEFGPRDSSELGTCSCNATRRCNVVSNTRQTMSKRLRR
jgi:hypothetical protein